MSYVNLILSAAKSVGLSGQLLLAICTHESHLQNILVPHDGNGPTFGVCQVKFETGLMVGYHGKPEGLMNPAMNVKIAAKYLKFQMDRYDQNICKAVAAYNAGKYNESRKVVGKPRNLQYVQFVQEKLPEELKYMLKCEE